MVMELVDQNTGKRSKRGRGRGRAKVREAKERGGEHLWGEVTRREGGR